MKMNLKVQFYAFCLTFLLAPGLAKADTIAYSNDFDGNETTASGVSGAFSGVGVTVGVQDYSGLGTGSNVFGGNFLINGAAGPGGGAARATVLTLTNLPTHTSVDINFLLAIIDSWDGDGTFGFQSDFFNVSVDGASIFSHSFLNSEASPANQTYVPAAGVELANDRNLGFSHHSQFRTTVEHWRDDAYDMGLDPVFNNIAHTGSTLTIEWFASGTGARGFQGGTDESWAIENVEVQLNGVNGGLASVPEPSSLLLLATGVGFLGFATQCRRRK